MKRPAPRVTFCDEFDRTTPLGGGWTSAPVSAASTIGILAEADQASLIAETQMREAEGYARRAD